jgi:PAS domain-containing protein
MAMHSNSGTGPSEPGRFFADAAARISAAFGAPRASDALPPEPGLLVALLDSLPDGVIACDPTGRLIFCNKSAERFLDPAAQPGDVDWWVNGSRAAEVDGRPREDDMPMPLARALAGERFVGVRLVVRDPDGTSRHRSVCGGPIRDAEGRLAGAVLVVREAASRMTSTT